MRYILLVVFLLTANYVFTQDKPSAPTQKLDTLSKSKKEGKKRIEKSEPPKITIKDYKIISFARDTTYLDTTLTIQKEYKYNYLRADDFELMPFSNVGQPYNNLGVDFERNNMYPQLGAKAKHFNYAEMEDINYYNVATPMTDILFKTTFEQGQLLDALLTFNTSRRLNFSIGYEGMRSLGKYNFDEGESGNFRATTNYVTKNGRYSLRAHIAAQSVDAEENGGITVREQFESGSDNFSNRVKVDVRFDNQRASNRILGKRYFLDHKFKLIKKQKDSSRVEKTSLALGHQFNYETKYYQFIQETQNSYFGNGLLSSVNDRANLKTMYNQVSLDFYNATLGSLQANVSLYNYNYFFNSVLVTDVQRIENQLKGEEVAFGANYEKQIGGFLVRGGIKYNLAGDLTGNIIDASASYRFNEKHKMAVGFHTSARMPDFNYLLYQSDYLDYNWQNTGTFKNERVNSLEVSFDSSVWGNISAKVTNLDNYTYFDLNPNPISVIEEDVENVILKPFQETSSIQYLKVKYSKEFKVGAFALNNTIMYQSVNQSSDVLNVPELVTRNTLYFSSDIFKKAMHLQTGVTFKYFTEYNMNAYNPLLGEFYIQNTEKIGGYPLLDFFINAKVQQTRIFLKAEHFNSSFSKNNYYSAPNYPYRDFVIRFGLVWNFFS
ncbi:putative porin [Maribacter sp. 2308TA10-17]|uniref:putative porin n=1 Tax=Maribacter sp. 2308TA10-17 TaxID=3386276 RepID=UPI0039BCB3BB